MDSKWTDIFANKARNLRGEHSWRLELDENIAPNRPSYGWKQCVINTCARFRCSSCGRGWSSNVVMVLFHMRLMDGNGIVKIRPLYQKCKICSDAPMEKPNVESHSITVLMDNLMEKLREKCYHEHTGQRKRHFRSYDGDKPHEPAHCQGCKLGLCRRK